MKKFINLFFLVVLLFCLFCNKPISEKDLLNKEVPYGIYGENISLKIII